MHWESPHMWLQWVSKILWRFWLSLRKFCGWLQWVSKNFVEVLIESRKILWKFGLSQKNFVEVWIESEKFCGSMDWESTNKVWLGIDSWKYAGCRLWVTTNVKKVCYDCLKVRWDYGLRVDKYVGSWLSVCWKMLWVSIETRHKVGLVIESRQNDVWLGIDSWRYEGADFEGIQMWFKFVMKVSKCGWIMNLDSTYKVGVVIESWKYADNLQWMSKMWWDYGLRVDNLVRVTVASRQCFEIRYWESTNKRGLTVESRQMLWNLVLRVDK